MIIFNIRASIILIISQQALFILDIHPVRHEQNVILNFWSIPHRDAAQLNTVLCEALEVVAVVIAQRIIEPVCGPIQTASRRIEPFAVMECGNVDVSHCLVLFVVSI